MARPTIDRHDDASLDRLVPITTNDAIVCRTPVVTSPTPGRVRIEADISTPRGPSTLWFDVPEDALPSTGLGDSFALGLVLPAMRNNRTLVVEDTVSESLLENLQELQAVYSMWFPEFSRIEVEPGETASDSAPADGVGLFFSGGVDSFYSLLTRDPTHLIYVDMLDTFDDDETLRATIRSSIQQVAAESSTRLLSVSTNLRAVLDRYSEWASHSHSLALGAIAHALAGELGSCIIAGDRTYDRMIPFGAHPLTIPMLGSARLPIQTSGWDLHRVDRTAMLTDSTLAMQHLRVCWENRDSAFNCAQCEKCLRTMAELTVWDSLERCETFPDTLDLEALQSVELSSISYVDYLAPTLDRARERSKNDLAAALETAIERVVRRATAEQLVGAFDDLDPGGADLGELVEIHHDTLFRALSRFKRRWLLGRVARDLPGWIVTKFKRLLRRIGPGARR